MKRKWQRNWKQRLMKKLAPPLLAGMMLLSSYNTVLANPSGGVVTAGAAAISTNGSTMTVNQTTNKAAINWQSFGIGSGETVRFIQPSASSVALNRVVGGNASAIYGTLSANGKVFLVNPSGILFAPGSQVNVGGLVASTLNLSDSDFLKGNYSFAKNGAAGSVVNQGEIRTSGGGYVAFLGPQVRNEGLVAAQAVGLAAGDKVSLDFDGDKLLSFRVDTLAAGAAATNSGSLLADGGTVVMSTGTKDALLNTVVNNTGLIQARTVNNVNGKIILEGSTVNVGGTLDASAPSGGDGGFIETSGANVNMAPGLRVTTLAPQGKTGNWLIDPLDFTVAASGGDMTGAAVSGWLAANNVTIQTTAGSSASNGTTNVPGASGTAGNININDAITWTNGNKLTLSAYNNIYINRSITNTGAGSLALVYGQKAVNEGNTSTYSINAPVNLTAGQHFSTKLGSDAEPTQFTVITSLGNVGSTSKTDLQGINGDLSGNYFLGANIDGSATSTWNSDGSGGYYGFMPIGDFSYKFTGVFDGGGHTISGLTINRPGENHVGLFGMTSGGKLGNLSLVNANISGNKFAGSLAGEVINTQITKISATALVTIVNVEGTSAAGGLVGSNSGAISNSYATGSVTGNYTYVNAGGLAGSNSGSISNSYATGSVTGIGNVGGLVGINNCGSISDSYATGSVTGHPSDNFYAAGGLVGKNGGHKDDNDTIKLGTISNSYATGMVSGRKVGGLVGAKLLYGFVTNSYWDKDTSGQATSDGGTGLTSAQMRGAGNFSGWADLVDGSGNKVWYFYDGLAAPLLRSFLTPLTVTVAGTNPTVEYSRTTYTSLGAVTNSVADPVLSGTLSYGKVADDAYAANTGNAGTYSLGGLYSGQQGYAITYAGATGLTITPKALSATQSAAVTKTYDKTNAATFGGSHISLTGILAGDTVNISSGAGTYAGVNAGDRTVAVTGVTLDNGNYSLSAANITSTSSAAGSLDGAITPAALTITAASASKVYDGTTASTATPTYEGLVAGDSLSGLTQTYNSKNVLGTGGSILTVSGGYTLTDGNSGHNYTVAMQTAAGTITPATLTAGLTGTVEKVYDGTNTATLTSGNYNALTGIIGGDVVSLNPVFNGSYADKNVNLNGDKAVTVTGLGLSGADASNYQLASTTLSGNVGKITPAALTITAVANTKTYDGGTSASTASTVTSGTIYAVDVHTLSEKYGDKKAGSNKLLIPEITFATASDAANYSITMVNANTGGINKAALTASLTGTVEKLYDGNTTATLTNANFNVSGKVSGDEVLFAGSGSYDNKNVGTGKNVTVPTYTLDGADAGNYYVSGSINGSVSGKITARPLTAGATAANKVYDGATSATISGGITLGNFIAGDDISAAYTSGAFADKNVGDNKTVTLSGITLTGTDAGNYSLAANSITSSASITPATLTITAKSDSKVYDGTTGSTVTPTDYTGLIAGDTLSGLAQTYGSKNVLGAGGSTLNVSAYTITDGNNGGNYTVVKQTAAGTIRPATLTITAKSDSKVYDGTTGSKVTPTDYTGLIGGDTLGGLAQTYGSKNVLGAGGSTLNVSAYTIADGNNGGNYTVVKQTAIGTITPASLTITAASATKVYDGTTSSAATPTYVGLKDGDTLSGLTQTYENKNVLGANGSTLTVSGGYTLTDGNSGNNYTVATQTGTGAITPAALTIAANNASRQIGMENPAFSATHAGLVPGDSLASLSGLLSYATPATKDSPAGTYAITPSGLTSDNYTITWVNGELTVNRPTDAYLSVLGTVAGLVAAPPPVPMLAATGLTVISATAPASGTPSGGAQGGTTDNSETPVSATGTPTSANPAGPSPTPTGAAGAGAPVITQVPGLPLTLTGPGINTGGHPVNIVAEQE